jgi:hypothetical protein
MKLFSIAIVALFTSVSAKADQIGREARGQGVGMFFEPMSLLCKSHDGDLSHEFAEVDHVAIGPAGLDMSVGPIATSSKAWVFENTDRYESLGHIDRFYMQDASGKRSTDGALGAGIRAGSPFFFDLSETKNKNDPYQFMFSISQNSTVYTVFFRCRKI